MKQVYPVIFTPLNDEKDTVLIEVPDLDILTEGYGMADAVEMARDAIGLKGISYQDKGIDLPEPSALNSIDVLQGTFAEEGTGCVSFVDINFDFVGDYKVEECVADYF